MKKLSLMNRMIFRKNLLAAVREITDASEDKIFFKVIPVYEKGKGYSAIDDVMRLVLLNDKNVGNRLLSIDATVTLLTGYAPLVPIWIDISFERNENNIIVLCLETSLRIRKPSLLRNIDTGHPPFRTIK